MTIPARIFRLINSWTKGKKKLRVKGKFKDKKKEEKEGKKDDAARSTYQNKVPPLFFFG